MIFSAEDLRHWVVRDTLKSLDDHSPAAENLLLGTAAQESGLGVCLHQGKRRGLYHLTAATHRSVWDKYLINNPELASRVRGMAGQHSFLKDPHSELVVDLPEQTISLEGSTLSTSFEIDPYKKVCLINGYDDIDYLVSKISAIEAFEKQA